MKMVTRLRAEHSVLSSDELKVEVIGKMSRRWQVIQHVVWPCYSLLWDVHGGLDRCYGTIE